jgi:hypothetical protein
MQHLIQTDSHQSPRDGALVGSRTPRAAFPISSSAGANDTAHCTNNTKAKRKRRGAQASLTRSVLSKMCSGNQAVNSSSDGPPVISSECNASLIWGLAASPSKCQPLSRCRRTVFSCPGRAPLQVLLHLHHAVDPPLEANTTYDVGLHLNYRGNQAPPLRSAERPSLARRIGLACREDG